MKKLKKNKVRNDEVVRNRMTERDVPVLHVLLSLQVPIMCFP